MKKVSKMAFNFWKEFKNIIVEKILLSLVLQVKDHIV